MICLLAIIASTAAALAVALAVYSKRWPSTSGRLIQAEVTSEVTIGEYSEHPSVLYEFVVAGRVYRSSLIRAFGTFSISASIPGFSSAAAQVADITNSKTLTVFYCPLYPGFACLKPGGVLVPTLLLLAALGLWAAWFAGVD